jgi:hypothetical protein
MFFWECLLKRYLKGQLYEQFEILFAVMNWLSLSLFKSLAMLLLICGGAFRYVFGINQFCLNRCSYYKSTNSYLQKFICKQKKMNSKLPIPLKNGISMIRKSARLLKLYSENRNFSLYVAKDLIKRFDVLTQTKWWRRHTESGLLTL